MNKVKEYTAVARTAFKFRVIDFDTSVNDIAAGSLSSRTVIGICGTALLGVGDTSEAPRSASLSLVLLCVNLNILVNVLNLSSMSNMLSMVNLGLQTAFKAWSFLIVVGEMLPEKPEKPEKSNS